MSTITLQQQGDALTMTIPPETIERERALVDKILREQAETLKALADL